MAEARFQHSIDIPLRFFEAEAERLSRACLAMARRFHRGGRLLAFGAGNAVADVLKRIVAAQPEVYLKTEVEVMLAKWRRGNGWPIAYRKEMR